MKVDEVIKLLTLDLKKTSTIVDIEKVHIKYLGRKGLINKLLQDIARLPQSERRKQGQRINESKKAVEALLLEKQRELLNSVNKSDFDITLPGKKRPRGSLHIVTYAIEEITKIFTKIGFIRMSYPEVEWEYFSFDSLNMPKGHPARDDFETFFIDYPTHKKFGKMVLTPHTSSGQVREMLRKKNPPIKMINIARTYRPNWDVSHTPMFHQFEGLCIDKDINLTHLKGTIEYFAQHFFGKNREIRLRPFHFQFTEPSFEVDITCDICEGYGVIDGVKCKLCKSGWLELGGTGMVHPNVLKEGNIDPHVFTGWAFGFGIERVMMMKAGLKLDDIRVLYSGDIRFLEQF